VVPEPLAVLLDLPGLAFLFRPGPRVLRDLAEGLDCPLRALPGDVRAEPVHPGVGRGRELPQVLLLGRVVDERYPVRPAALREGDQVGDAGLLADPGVDDGGNVPSARQRPAVHGGLHDLAGIQAGGLDGAQGAPQPGRFR